MFVSDHAIVLSTVKYAEKDLIIKCYTKTYGVVSFIEKGVLKTRKKSIRVAHFQVLSQLQIEYNFQDKKQLQTLKDVRLIHHYSSLHTNIYKSAIVMFLAEVLTHSIQEEEPNTILYTYIENALLWLDTHSHYANFHLLFLLKLTKYLGFYPDTVTETERYFNLETGKFQTQYHNKHSISGQNLTLLKLLLGTTFEALPEVEINSMQRQSFLTMLLVYFKLHLGNFKTPKSLQILNQVFN